MRSEIETFIANFTKTFRRFNKKNIVRITEHNIYHLQFKLSSVLYNLKRFKEYFKVEDNYLYNKWLTEDFDFFNDNEINSQFNISYTNKKYKQDYINNKNDDQDIFIKSLIKSFDLNLNDNNTTPEKINTEDAMEDVISTSKNNNPINNININDDDNWYIEKIIGHKYFNYVLKINVKFTNNKEKWIDVGEYNSLDYIDNYWKSTNI